jgi:hypothetical protein
MSAEEWRAGGFDLRSCDAARGLTSTWSIRAIRSKCSAAHVGVNEKLFTSSRTLGKLQIMKSEVVTLRKLNRHHERLVIKLSRQLEAARRKIKRLQQRQTKMGRN